MNFSPTVWLFVFMVALVFGCLISFFFGMWWGVVALFATLIVIPAAMVVILYVSWMDRGSH
jgi:cytochrome c oxidase subunit IV